ncbi:stAR-related lipid transfer protein 7, mitochondrial [Morus notabilis]|uniref:stAR-related lipid transfer protein 7, mitochondrial n=1 Tax=Morus notabilis TaxID=981085 RepID=UPI000CED0A84|nr:stAR-related lipid transfer protein 7, mitochondrial [Morus notabilis]
MSKFWDFLSSTSGGFSEDFWRRNFHGGWATFLALLLIFLWHSSRRFSFPFSFSFLSRSSSSSAIADCSNPNASPSQTPQLGVSEVVSEADLLFLMESLDEKLSVDEKWDSVIDKRNNLLSYSAKCCKTKDGPLKYLSVTVFENCSPEILRDFYMDNDYRKQWDKTIVEHWQLHVDDNNGVEVGRTIKKFPFLTPREYVLAWRLWEGKDESFYCFIKECEHPLAPKQKKYVRVSVFRSGWRIRKVPGRDACEIKMFHQEDAGLNVEMAKLVFSKGIWSYVCKMDSALRKYPTIRLPQSSSANAVTLIKMVPPELDTTRDGTSQATSAPTGVQGSVTGLERKLSRRPCGKMVANGLLLIGGVICLSRGHSSLGAKVALAYILSKLSKRGASSSQGNQI